MSDIGRPIANTFGVQKHDSLKLWKIYVILKRRKRRALAIAAAHYYVESLRSAFHTLRTKVRTGRMSYIHKMILVQRQKEWKAQKHRRAVRRALRYLRGNLPMHKHRKALEHCRTRVLSTVFGALVRYTTEEHQHTAESLRIATEYETSSQCKCVFRTVARRAMQQHIANKNLLLSAAFHGLLIKKKAILRLTDHCRVQENAQNVCEKTIIFMRRKKRSLLGAVVTELFGRLARRNDTMKKLCIQYRDSLLDVINALRRNCINRSTTMTSLQHKQHWRNDRRKRICLYKWRKFRERIVWQRYVKSVALSQQHEAFTVRTQQYMTSLYSDILNVRRCMEFWKLWCDQRMLRAEAQDIITNAIAEGKSARAVRQWLRCVVKARRTRIMLQLVDETANTNRERRAIVRLVRQLKRGYQRELHRETLEAHEKTTKRFRQLVTGFHMIVHRTTETSTRKVQEEDSALSYRRGLLHSAVGRLRDNNVGLKSQRTSTRKAVFVQYLRAIGSALMEIATNHASQVSSRENILRSIVFWKVWRHQQGWQRWRKYLKARLQRRQEVREAKADFHMYMKVESCRRWINTATESAQQSREGRLKWSVWRCAMHWRTLTRRRNQLRRAGYMISVPRVQPSVPSVHEIDARRYTTLAVTDPPSVYPHERLTEGDEAGRKLHSHHSFVSPLAKAPPRTLDRYIAANAPNSAPSYRTSTGAAGIGPPTSVVPTGQGLGEILRQNLIPMQPSIAHDVLHRKAPPDNIKQPFWESREQVQTAHLLGSEAGIDPRAPPRGLFQRQSYGYGGTRTHAIEGMQAIQPTQDVQAHRQMQRRHEYLQANSSEYVNPPYQHQHAHDKYTGQEYSRGNVGDLDSDVHSMSVDTSAGSAASASKRHQKLAFAMEIIDFVQSLQDQMPTLSLGSTQ